MSESNIAVLVIGAALASGAIWLGDPPQPPVALATVHAAAQPAQSDLQPSATRRLADATIDCVVHPDASGCRAQIVASVAADPQELPRAEAAVHASAHGCLTGANGAMQSDCAVSGDAVAL